ncbi:MAG TPA: hypothetical protein DIS90_09825, partial [Cytophagales bacterium]|nr:hypothetical protein [Cytophagales bacterium]
QMNWITIYITGEDGFKEEVLRRLEHSDLEFMPGYIGNSMETNNYDMYWIDKDLDIRALKEAIGAKTIWKYRIRVYQSLEQFIGSQNNESNGFTDHDNELIQEMRRGLIKRTA